MILPAVRKYKNTFQSSRKLSDFEGTNKTFHKVAEVSSRGQL
jgi:hypothetical protein